MNNLFIKERATGRKIIGPADVFKSCIEMVDADQELFMIIGYNTRNVETFREIVFKGGIDACSIDVKTIFRHLLLKGCTGFICVHNHPGGESSPSKNDDKVTQRIKDVSELLNITLVDHLIVSDDGYYSYADTGRLGFESP